MPERGELIQPEVINDAVALGPIQTGDEVEILANPVTGQFYVRKKAI